MKEFIEKLIDRLEEKAIEHRETGFEMERKGFSNIADKQYAKQTTYLNAIEIVNQLAEEYNNSNDSMEIQIAKNYAKCLVKYGVDIREKWETATSQSMALEQAYLRGRQDERDRFAEWQEEYGKDTNVSTIDAGELLGNGWIPCNVRLPSDCENVYATCVSLIDNREPWVIEGIYFSGCGGFERMTPMLEYGDAKVIAWMSKKFPESYQPKGE